MPQWLQHDLEQIQHANLRAATLTRQLLAFSRRQVLNPRIIKLNSVIESLLPILSRLVGPAIHIQATLDPELVSIHVDPSQIEQVVINLVTNARDALPHGGDIVISSQNLDGSSTNPHYPHLEPGIYAMVSVHDTGSGILPEVQSRIFEPFFTTKEQGRGTGLGLATAHGILKQSGGQIWFESAPDHGTTFFFCLPNTTNSTDQQEDQPTKQKAPNLHTSTIILVEDDTAVRLLTRTILERNGFRVIEATPEEAEAYAHNPAMTFDMVLTDVMMPGIDGVELSRRMLAARPQLPILFMSGYTNTVILNSDTRAGRSDFLQKPFTPSSLIAKVRGILHAAEEQHNE
ncbi:MAG: hypothetical protein Fur005_15800 [Roseiflexaceae bacterium]